MSVCLRAGRGCIQFRQGETSTTHAFTSTSKRFKRYKISIQLITKYFIYLKILSFFCNFFPLDYNEGTRVCMCVSKLILAVDCHTCGSVT